MVALLVYWKAAVLVDGLAVLLVGKWAALLVVLLVATMAAKKAFWMAFSLVGKTVVQ